jgi:peptidoglycan-associated lipoprotein
MSKQAIVIFFITIICVAACTPKATRLFNKAEKQFNQAEYQTAIENYKQSIAKGYKQGSVANYRIAEAFRRSNRIHEAESFYEKAVASKIDEEEAYFWYAQSLKSNGKYENARKQFQKYIAMGTNFDLVNRAKKEMQNIDVISEITKRQDQYEIKNIEQLNTAEAEYSPIISKGKLYFTTNRGVTQMHKATNTGFTDVWEFTFDGVGEFTGQGKALPEAINTTNAHEATPIFSRDGKTMYFSRGNTGNKKGSKDVDIYMAKQQGGIWGAPVLVPVSHDDSWDSSPALSADGRKLYFASNREGGNGGVDIYVSTIDSSGKWGNVKNLGSPVNTRGNDMFPYEDEKGNFYFSSDGHPSLGALDIFKVVKKKGQVTIENLGSPVNSSFDDFALFAKDTAQGFFSSNRPNGKGDDDIYEYNIFKKANYTVQGKTVTLDSGLVISEAYVTITKLNGDTVATVLSDKDGNFHFKAEPEQEYNVTAQREGFWAYADKYSTVGKTVSKDKLKPGINEISFDMKVEMKKKIKDEVIVIDNVYYDYDKWAIRPDAAVALNTVVKLMTDNPDINVELSSHTDERGSADYNRKLSQKRAESAVAYIISQGVANTRITAKGWGEDHPIVKNAKSEEEHQTNRRTEMKVTNITKPNLKIIRKGEENLIQSDASENGSEAERLQSDQQSTGNLPDITNPDVAPENTPAQPTPVPSSQEPAPAEQQSPSGKE